MKTKNLHHIALLFITLVMASTNAIAQVGIGTANPDPSALMDMQSHSKGLLAPRMTTLERNAIANPAESLLVYDTDEKAFFYYNSTTSAWVMLANDNSVKRNNYKLIKSEADLSDELTAGGGSKYLLDSSTLYEVNGTILLAYPIELNDAYLIGADTNEDKLIKTTTSPLFTGGTGGTVKHLTLSNNGGSIFNLTGTGTQNLFIRTVVIANSASVGSIEKYDFALLTFVTYTGNTSGITFTDINHLLLSDNGWLNTNSGTYETYLGTFTFIGNQGGFMAVDGTAIGIDVSGNPAVATGVLSGISFSGSSTQYIKKYTIGSYPNYNFTKEWTVNCPGIKTESDEYASANIYFSGGITTGFVQEVSDNNEFNLMGGTSSPNNTTAVNMLRATSAENNRITYTGKKTRTFQVNAALSVRGNAGVGDFYAFFIEKNGVTTLIETNSLMRVNSTSDISSLAITGTVELAPNDYIEIWGQRLTGSTTYNITVFSLNLNIR